MFSRRLVLLAVLSGVAVPASFADEVPNYRAKADQAVVQSLEAGQPVKVMVRIRARQLLDDVLKETDGIHADRSKDEAQKRHSNDAAWAQYRRRLDDLKARVFPAAGRPGIEKVGEVPSGPEVLAILSTLAALEELASDPFVEYIFVEQKVYLNGGVRASP